MSASPCHMFRIKGIMSLRPRSHPDPRLMIKVIKRLRVLDGHRVQGREYAKQATQVNRTLERKRSLGGCVPYLVIHLMTFKCFPITLGPREHHQRPDRGEASFLHILGNLVLTVYI